MPINAGTTETQVAKQTQTVKLHVGKIVVVKREYLPAPCPLFFCLKYETAPVLQRSNSNSVHCCLRMAHNGDNSISSLNFVFQRDEFLIFYSVVFIVRVIMNLHNDQKTKRLEGIEFSRPHCLYCLSSAHNRKIIKSTFSTPQLKRMIFICSITDRVFNGRCHPI